MDIADVRNRVRWVIDESKKRSGERRTRVDAAQRAYETFLTTIAEPVFKMAATSLTAEKHPFKVFTPAESIRLASAHHPDDFIEITLDAAADPPVVVGRVRLSRGQRVQERERPVREGAAVDQLTDEDVLSFLLAELRAFVER